MGKKKILPLVDCVDEQLERDAITIYACEGYKTYGYIVGVVNSNPSIIERFVDYLIMIGVPKSEIKIRIQIHDDLNADKVRNFWKSKFKDIRYVGERLRKTKSKRNKVKYGIAHLEVCSTQLFDHVMGKVLQAFPSC